MTVCVGVLMAELLGQTHHRRPRCVCPFGDDVFVGSSRLGHRRLGLRYKDKGVNLTAKAAEAGGPDGGRIAVKCGWLACSGYTTLRGAAADTTEL